MRPSQRVLSCGSVNRPSIVAIKAASRSFASSSGAGGSGSKDAAGATSKWSGPEPTFSYDSWRPEWLESIFPKKPIDPSYLYQAKGTPWEGAEVTPEAPREWGMTDAEFLFQQPKQQRQGSDAWFGFDTVHPPHVPLPVWYPHQAELLDKWATQDVPPLPGSGFKFYMAEPEDWNVFYDRVEPDFSGNLNWALGAGASMAKRVRAKRVWERAQGRRQRLPFWHNFYAASKWPVDVERQAKIDAEDALRMSPDKFV